MGHHYIPKAYLRRFAVEDDDRLIEVFDKEQKRFYRSSIVKAAQEKGYYHEEAERQLAAEIEDPAKPGLDALCEGQDLSADDRHIVARYAASFLTRVEHARRRRKASLAEITPEIVAEVRSQLKEYQESGQAKPEVLSKRLQELEGLEDRLLKSPSPILVDRIRDPFPQDSYVDAIERMTWRIANTNGPQYFVTTDNPGFFFGSYGLSRPESEFSFPLSAKVALYGAFSHQGSSLQFMGEIGQRFVRELNRRLVSESTRFIFSSRKERWLPRVAAKKRPYLSRIQWE